MVVDRGGRGPLACLEWGIQVPHRGPVRLERDGLGEVEAAVGVRIARRVPGRGEQAAEAGLGSAGGHGCAGGVDAVDAGLDRREQGRHLPAGGVVGVQAQRDVEPVPDRLDQDPCSGWAQEAGHVLDDQAVHAGGDVGLGDAQVVVQGVGGLGGAEEVAGVADRAFGVAGVLADRVDHRPGPVHVVERVEYPEDVHPRRRGRARRTR